MVSVLASSAVYRGFDQEADRPGRARMVVGFTTNYAISAYHHISCEFESRSWRRVRDTTLCDKVCH